jgi:secreted PhoX family phosphatase
MKRRTKWFAGGTLALALVCGGAVAGGEGGFKTHEDAMMSGDTSNADAGWTVTPLITIGEESKNGADVNEKWFGYRIPGILDGIGAFVIDKDTLRVLVNHEFGDTVGYAYKLDNGTTLTGARVSYIDIDRNSRKVEAAGPAYGRVYDRAGAVVTDPNQISEGAGGNRGFNRFCSAYGVAAGDNGFEDNVFLTGEETGGGQECALDVDNGDLYVVPMMGRAAFENVCPVENFGTDKVVILIGDDRGGAPLVLYIGEKGAAPASGYSPPSFLKDNGLGFGHLYVWVADNGDDDPSDFNGTGNDREGKFVRIEHYDASEAGNAGFDSLGFVTQALQDTRAFAEGAFHFSRPEDIARNPEDGTQLVLASTGRDSLYPDDSWGTTYLVDFDDSDLEDLLEGDLDDIDDIPATIKILYDGDDAGDGQFSHPDFGLRSPDNLDWASDGYIYINEDRSFGGFCQTADAEASVWQLDPGNGELVRILEMDRSAVPNGQSDNDPSDCGDWESSGLLDVTAYFKTQKGETLLIFDVQAHSVRDGGVGGSSDLVQGGQLLLLSNRNSDNGKSNDK